MADRILKPDSGNDLVLQNDDASAKIEINEAGTIVHTGTSSIDVSGGTFTTSSAQKTAIVDGGKGNLTKSDVGLSNVTNDAQVPASGGTFSGDVAVNGDLTVDTDTMFVDSSSNLVGIGATSPHSLLDVRGTADNANLNTLTLQNDDYGANETGQAITQLFRLNRAGTMRDAGSIKVGKEGDWDDATNADSFLSISTTINDTLTERFKIDASGNVKFNSGYGSNVTAYGVRAWVRFDGVGTVSISGSGNVSSITDNGTGDYTVNITTAMPDTNYAAVMYNNAYHTATTYNNQFLGGLVNRTTSSVDIKTHNGTSITDSKLVDVLIVR
jgi:hypothetical protein